jgi:hypothetical protein
LAFKNMDVVYFVNPNFRKLVVTLPGPTSIPTRIL